MMQLAHTAHAARGARAALGPHLPPRTDAGGCAVGHAVPRGKMSPVKQAARCYVRAHAASPVEAAERSTSNNGNGASTGSHAAGAVQEQQPAQDAQQDRFDWTKAWYPVAILADLPTNRPTPVRLLGNAIVLWRDGEGVWRAFQDLCPHRLAPLSEGRVENGELMCSYHGWQFRGSDGRATVIPQAVDAKANDAACASRRACCTAHPCAVQDGLVWVWGSSGPAAEAESGGVPRVCSPKFGEEGSVQLTPWFLRDLPYDAEILCENVLDPSHVPFSHHGVQGNRFKAPKLVMGPAEVSPKGGVSVLNKLAEGATNPRLAKGYELSFRPPTSIRYAFGTGNELVTHAVPTDPGRCRIFFTLMFPRERVSWKMGALLRLLHSRPLLWKDHLERNEVLDGDNVFLALQEDELRARQQHGPQPDGTWARHYYLPTTQDHAILGFRRWQAECALPIPWAPSALPPHAPGRSRREMLDRLNQHTRHCPSCAAAHRNFGLLQQAATYAGIIAAAYAAFALGNQQPLRKLLAPALASLAAAWLARTAAATRAKLEFKDYRHPDHH